MKERAIHMYVRMDGLIDVTIYVSMYPSMYVHSNVYLQSFNNQVKVFHLTETERKK